MEAEEIGRSPDVCYLIDSGFCLRGFNNAWILFAQQNGGEKVLDHYPLGRSIMDSIPEDLKTYYRLFYEEVLQKKKRFDHDFLCSSPERIRKFRQITYPLKDGKGLLICNHLLLEEMPDKTAAGSTPSHRNESGFIVQCAHCRCVKNQVSGGWDWIPELIASPRPDISHSLCPQCYQFYYRDFLS